MTAKSLMVGLIGGAAIAAPAFLAGCATTPPGGSSAAPSAFTVTLGACTAATQTIAYGVANGYATDPEKKPMIDAVIGAATPICGGPAPTASQPINATVAQIAALNAAINALNQYALTHTGK